jgi:hypothetical protein
MTGMDIGTDRAGSRRNRRDRSTAQPAQPIRDASPGTDNKESLHSLNGRPASHRRDGSHDARVRYGRPHRFRFAALPERGIATSLFDALVVPRLTFVGECWIAAGRANTGGYRQIQVDGRHYLAHRLSFHAFVRELGREECVLHACDVRRCVNPAHLRAGTYEDNALDMARKGRAGRTRIPDDVARAVLADSGTLAAIAKRHGISKSHAGMIRQRRTRRYLP